MWVEAPEPAHGASVEVGSFDRSRPRYRSPVGGATDARPSPTATLERLRQGVSGMLSPPVSRSRLGWQRGRTEKSGTGHLHPVRNSPMQGEPRTSPASPFRKE